MKLKIDNETLAQEFFEDSLLLGIVAPVKDYQFSWQLNQILGFNFRVNNDFEIELKKKSVNIFSLFTNMQCLLPAWYIIYTITSLMENIYYQNLSTSIFCG
jgi:hypothetical protein